MVASWLEWYQEWKRKDQRRLQDYYPGDTKINEQGKIALKGRWVSFGLVFYDEGDTSK